MEAGLAIVALAVAGAAIAFCYWCARWARDESRGATASAVEIVRLEGRVDDLQRAVDDRNHAIAAKQDELNRTASKAGVADRQLSEAIALVEELAAKQPAAVGAAIRAHLERMRALATTSDDDTVPGTVAAAAAAGGGDPRPVHGPGPAGRHPPP